MNIIQLQDGRSLLVCEILKNIDAKSNVVKTIKNNRRYELIIKDRNNVLLCNEIPDATYEMILQPNISNIKITPEEIKDKYSSDTPTGNNVDINI